MPRTESSPHLAYTLSGPVGAPLVVFVNGLGGAQAAFTLQVRDFCKTHRVLTFDHRGMGQSDVVDQPAHMADFWCSAHLMSDYLWFFLRHESFG